MIKGLMGSQGIMVSGGNTSVPYVNQNTNNPMTGMVRVWGSDMQVFDGSSWINMTTSYATATLEPEIQNLLAWARSKQQQEIELLEAATKNEAVRIALENVKKAQDQLTIIAHLSRDYEETTS
jgi:hypothetical protein